MANNYCNVLHVHSGTSTISLRHTALYAIEQQCLICEMTGPECCSIASTSAGANCANISAYLNGTEGMP